MLDAVFFGQIIYKTKITSIRMAKVVDCLASIGKSIANQIVRASAYILYD